MSNLEAKIVFKVENGGVVISSINGIEQKMAGATKQTNMLGNAFKSLLPAMSVVLIAKFFADSVKAAEKENEILRTLKGTIEANNISWTDAEKVVRAYGKTVLENTRFTDEQAYASVKQFTQATGDLSNAIALSNLAMNLSVKFGKDLSETQSILSNALANPQRGALQLRREFGALAGDGNNVIAMIKTLEEKSGKAATEEENLTNKVSKLKNAFEELEEYIGTLFIPVVSFLTDKFTKLLTVIPTTFNIAGNSLAQLFARMIGDKKTLEVLQEDMVKIVEKSDKKIEDSKSKSNNKINAEQLKAQQKRRAAEKQAEEDAKKAKEKEIADTKKLEADAYAQRLAAGNKFASAQKTLVEDLAAGNEDAWKNYYKNIVDFAFAVAEADLTAKLAEATAAAFLPPFNWIAVGGIAAQLLGLEGLKAGLKMPAMAQGGIVKASPGGTPVIVGEAGSDEAIIPLNKSGIGRNYTININGFADKSTVDYLIRELKKRENSGGGF